jgi:hypothetical protein
VGRLRDAIVLGYQLHRSATLPGGRLDLEVPEWYSSWASEATPAPSPGGASPLPEPLLDPHPRAPWDDPAHRSAHPPRTGAAHTSCAVLMKADLVFRLNRIGRAGSSLSYSAALSLPSKL